MKYFIRILILLVFPLFSDGQITSPVIKAGFGVDADLRANFFNGFVQSGNDDWFNNGTAGTGTYVIDTTGAAAVVAAYLSDASPWPRRMAPLYRSMRFPTYTIWNNRLWLDAIFVRDYHGTDTTVFAAGSNKNGMSPANWSCPVAQAIPDKNDILDMFMHIKRAGPTINDSLWMMGGLSLDNVTGNRYFDFEMYQTDIYYDRASRQWYGYGPDMGHTSWQLDAAGNVIRAGDIILTGEFQSSTMTNIEARIWVHQSTLSITPANWNWSGQFDGAYNGAPYGYASILPKTAGAFYTGLGSNNNTWAGPFMVVLQDNSLATNYIKDQFMEFSVNLTKLGLDPVTAFGGDICGTPFNRIVVKTRASSSFTAELKDFVAPIDLFLAPRVEAEADVPIFCVDLNTSTITVTNPHTSSLYTWTTPDGHIVGSNIGTSIVVDSVGTYIVNQQLIAGCPVYASDTVVITRVDDCSVLPGYFKTFSGYYNIDEKDTRLSWSVMNNENIQSFVVERSTDGARYSPIQQVSGTQSPGDYNYYTNDDLELINAPTVYYRIKLVNSDGSYRYSKVISIIPQRSLTNDVIISPNPARDYVQVSIQSSGDYMAEIAIVNQQGKIMKLIKEPVSRGINIINLTEPANWSGGMYYVMIQLGDKLIHKKLVVLD